MIVSHKHRFVFPKSQKTGGTSLELALSRICGEDDIITPLHERHERERNEIGGLGPRNTDVPIRRHRSRVGISFGRAVDEEHSGST